MPLPSKPPLLRQGWHGLCRGTGQIQPLGRKASGAAAQISIKENSMKKHGTTIILLIVLIVGLSLLLYPTFADWWNSMHQSRAVASYVEQVANIDKDQYEAIWNAAWEYNQSLSKNPNRFLLTEQQKVQYDKLLDIGGTGIMGYVEVPAVGITLPIYHGTNEAILQVAVGHLEWTSLPVGGEGSQRQAVYRYRPAGGGGCVRVSRAGRDPYL